MWSVATAPHLISCVVCMKPAKGQHYNVVTCEGCKSFFRRSILKNMRYPACRLDGRCYFDITEEIRPKKCQWCRMQKCWQSGMMPRMKDTCSEELSDGTWLVPKMRNDLFHVEAKLRHLRFSTYNPIKFPSIAEIIRAPVIFNLADAYEAMPGWPLSEQEFFEKQKALTDTANMFEDNYFLIPATHDVSINTKSWMSFDLMLSAHYVKTFSFFNNLSKADKTRLISSTVLPLASLTVHFSSFQNKMADIQVPDGTILNGKNVKLIYEFVLGVKMDEYFLKFCHESSSRNVLEPLFRDNITYEEYIFLKTIIVCNPALTISKHARNILEKERQKYGRALLDYCLLHHGVNGPSRFVVVLDYINTFTRNEKEFRDMVFLRTIGASNGADSQKSLKDEVLFPN